MAGNVTRRNFMRLATDSLVYLPAVLGGFLAVTPEEALAVEGTDGSWDYEKDGGAFKNAEAQVIAVNPNEVGFMVVDMSDGGSTRVAGAHVRVGSRYNGKTAEGITDAQGIVVLDIAELAENPDGAAVLSTYKFNGSIEVTCPGFRDFETSMFRVEGGSGVRVPTRNLSEDRPYPSRVSFDDWDVLYTTELTNFDTRDKTPDATKDPLAGMRLFNASADNTDNHSLRIVVKNMHALSEASWVKLDVVVQQNNNLVLSQTVHVENDMIDVTFTKQFLNLNSPDVLPLYAPMVVRITSMIRYCEFPINLLAEKTVFPKATVVKNLTAKPLMTPANHESYNSGFRLSFPPSFPLGGKDMFTVWMPEFPINLFLDPTGYVQLSARTPSWGYINDAGKPNEAGWKTFPRDAVSKQIADKQKSWDSIVQKAANAYDMDSGSSGQIDYSRTFKASTFLRFMAVGKWNKDKGTFTGNAVGQLVVAMDFSISENFLAGPIPVLIQFAFNSSLSFALGIGFNVAPEKGAKDPDLLALITDLERWNWEHDNNGFTMTLIIAPSLSVGVGLKGVASVSLRGLFALTVFVGLTSQPDSSKDLPHVIVGYKVKADIVAQFFLWSYAWSVFDGGDPNYYNNWEGGLSGHSDNGILNPLANQSLEEFLEGMVPVTDDMLQASVEFDGSTPLVTHEEGAAEPTVAFKTEFVDDRPMEDGSTITYAIYTLELTGQDGAAQGEQAPEQAEVPADQAAPVDVVAPEAQNADPNVAADATLAAMAVESLAAQEDVPAEGASELVAMEEESFVPDAVPLVDEVAVDEPLADGTDVAYEEPAPAPEEVAGDVPAEGQEGEQPQGEAAPEEAQDTEAPQDEVITSPFAYPIPGNYTVVPREEDFGLVAMADQVPGVSGIGNKGGIRPTVDTVVAANVFGNPRIQVLEIQGTVYALRICTVRISGKLRTRLTSEVISGHRPAHAKQVLDFSLQPAIEGMLREDLCDYEFAAVPEKYYESHGMTSLEAYRLQVTFISGLRNVTNLAKTATSLVLSHVQFHHHVDNGFDYVLTSTSWSGDKVFAKGDILPYHSISNLDLTIYNAGSGTHVATITYLDRMGNTPEDVLTDTVAKVRMGLVLVPYSETSVANTFIVPDPAEIENKMGAIADKTAYELRFWPRVGSYYSFMIRGASKAYYYVMQLDPDSPNVPVVWRINYAGEVDARVRFHPWKAVSSGGMSPSEYQHFLTCDTAGKLSEAWIDSPYYKPELRFSGIGSENFGVTSFGVRGEFIYWPVATNGTSGQQLDEGSGKLVDMPEVKECRLMAARIRNGRFSDPFVMADLDHNIDMIVRMDASNTALTLVGSELVDSNKDLANIWYLSIPFVKTVTCVACEPVSPFVSPGKPAQFYVSLRNDGNTFLAGCDVAMYDKDTSLAEPAGVGQVTFSKETIRESAWNPKDANGNLKGVEPDYVLAPGKTSLYIMQIDIPQGWSGRKNLVFVARDGRMISGMVGMDEESEANVVEYSIPPEQAAEAAMDTVVIDDLEYWDEAFMWDAPVGIATSSEGVPPSPMSGGGASGASGSNASSGSGSSGKGGSNGSSSGSKSRLPRTGDPASLAVAAGLAAAGAAITALGKAVREDEE